MSSLLEGYKETCDAIAGGMIEVITKTLKAHYPLISKDSTKECISYVGFILFDSYKKKEVLDGEEKK